MILVLEANLLPGALEFFTDTPNLLLLGANLEISFFWVKQIWDKLDDNSLGFGCKEEYTTTILILVLIH